MDMAKSLFGSRDHDGYVGKEEHQVCLKMNEKYAKNIHLRKINNMFLIILQRKLDSHDSIDENELCDITEGLSMTESITPTQGGPFSALTPSMWPMEILAKLGQAEANASPNHQPEYHFDEFGFRVEVEDGPEQSSNRLLSIPFIEDPNHRWVQLKPMNETVNSQL
jgi:hypothetical protein